MKKSSWFVLLAIVLLGATFACKPTQPEPTVLIAPTSIPPTTAPGTPGAALPTKVPTLPPSTQAPPPTGTTPPPTTVPPTLPPPTAVPPAGLAILSFNVTIEDIPSGKRLTFTWQTTGAVGVTIWSGTKQRFPDAWEGPANGSLVKDLAFTYYRDPSMMLVARDGGGNTVSQSVNVTWPCEYDYFFSTDIARCPAYEASETWAAEQTFEHGRMIWLQEIDAGGGPIEGMIIVLYDDGSFAKYNDTWDESLPESDPSIVPPAGLLQPIRGFGKLWRETTGVRDKLGWATAAEEGFNATWQPQIAESLGATAFVRRLDGTIVRVSGWDVGSGTWEAITP